MATEWYRKTTWTPANAEDFETRLMRSRGVYNKSQYLRIQATHLQRASPPNYDAAIRLLDRVLNEWRDDSQVASALLQKAECLDATATFSAALPYYREGFAFERTHPGWRTSVWIILPWRIVKEKRIDLYDEALDAISFGSGSGVAFAVDQYRLNVVEAIIRKQKGDDVLARSFAKDAYEAAGYTHSGFRYHKDVGLVREIEPWAKIELDRILAA